MGKIAKYINGKVERAAVAGKREERCESGEREFTRQQIRAIM